MDLPSYIDPVEFQKLLPPGMSVDAFLSQIPKNMDLTSYLQSTPNLTGGVNSQNRAGYRIETDPLLKLMESAKASSLNPPSVLTPPPVSTDITAPIPGEPGASPASYMDKLLQDSFNKIGAPSSVDTVQKSLDTQALQQLLAEIDRETNANVASTKLDYQDLGISGPGQESDIAQNAIAQIRTGGGRTKATAQLQGYQFGLTRQQAKEESDSKMRISLLDYLLQDRQLSTQERQFYEKMKYDEQQAGLARTAAYNNAILGTRDNSPYGFMPSLMQGIGAVKGITGIASDLWNPGGGAGLLTK